MDVIENHIETILKRKEKKILRVDTLGYFQVSLQDQIIPDSEWKRDIAVQLFQFFITIRNQRALHKEQIIYQLWGDVSQDVGSRNFKTALHNILKVIEPDKPSRSPSEYIIRQGLSYRLNKEEMWIDIDCLDDLIVFGNQQLHQNPTLAAEAYQHATDLYQGVYFPNRIYEDWTAEERERIQVLVLGAMMTLAKLKVKENPMESIRLAKRTLSIDATWEDAYRIQMEAYMEEGNRPMAVKAYRQCQQILQKEFDIEPLPETKALFRRISEIG
ncbi:MAG: bacterial transcriptional activator domain-containing protein [Chitinophagales bacterium]